jgi:hypothetical protein
MTNKGATEMPSLMPEHVLENSIHDLVQNIQRGAQGSQNIVMGTENSQTNYNAPVTQIYSIR